MRCNLITDTTKEEEEKIMKNNFNMFYDSTIKKNIEMTTAKAVKPSTINKLSIENTAFRASYS